jgi:hypothetical protein
MHEIDNYKSSEVNQEPTRGKFARTAYTRKDIAKFKRIAQKMRVAELKAKSGRGVYRPEGQAIVSAVVDQIKGSGSK